MRERLGYSCSFAVISVITVALVAIVYWPVVHANFVWDDVVDLHDRAWLRHGDDWKHFIFKDYNYWTNYFRPLGVSLLTLQVRLFNDAPGPMHVVSLCIHWINTFLVGVLSWLCLANTAENSKSKYLVAASMLFYGLNPVLIEPVAWISCQFDLVVTTFVLIGVIANSSARNIYLRAGLLACLFFLAACTKESAISFPLILIVFEWLLLGKQPEQDIRSNIFAIVRHSWLVYVAIFFAGIVYLAFRHWALGKIISPFAVSPLSMLGRVQEVCFLYLHYWKTLIWPMSGMSPIHPVDVQQFNVQSLPLLVSDIAAISLLLIGLYLTARRAPTVGCIILVVTAALLPVLHIASADFDSSLYHERYAMTALAAICPMLPLAFLRLTSPSNSRKLMLALLATVGLFWLALAVINIRVTLPLWANNVNLWHWAMVENPDSIEAKDSLLSAYIDSKDYTNAHRLIDELAINHVDCANCMLNAAILDISENNPTDAAKALDQVKRSKQILVDKKMFGSYLLTTGQMLVLQGHLDDAEGALRAAIDIEPLDPQPRISLAIALAIHGKADDARNVGEAGILMLPADERDLQRKALNKAIALNGKSTSPIKQKN
jgi:hypothetical protein